MQQRRPRGRGGGAAGGVPPRSVFFRVRQTVRVGLATTPTARITPSTGMTWFSSTLPASEDAMGKVAGGSS